MKKIIILLLFAASSLFAQYLDPSELSSFFMLYNGSGNSAPDTTTATPGIPTITVVGGITKITLTANESGVDSIRWYRGTSADPTTWVFSTVPIITKLDSPKTAGTVYHYRAKNKIAWNLGDYSNDVSDTANVVPKIAYKYYQLDITLWASATAGLGEFRVYDRTTSLFTAPGSEATSLGLTPMNTAANSTHNGDGNINNGQWWNYWTGLGFGANTELNFIVTFNTIAPSPALAYTITSGNSNDRAPISWTVKGSNDNSNWTTLDTQSNITWTAQYQPSIKSFIIP